MKERVTFNGQAVNRDRHINSLGLKVREHVQPGPVLPAERHLPGRSANESSGDGF
jgi:hypothetical protein